MKYAFSIKAMIRDHHEYKDIWDWCSSQRNVRDLGSIYDTFAVAVVKENTIVGHCPRKISVLCFIFIRRDGSITCQVDWWKTIFIRFTLEIPCALKFQSNSKQDTQKGEKLIRNSLRMSISDILPSSVIGDQHIFLPIGLKLLSY